MSSVTRHPKEHHPPWNRPFPIPSLESASASIRLGCVFDLAEKRRQIGELEALSVEPGFWDSPQKAQRAMQKITVLRSAVDDWERMDQQVSDLAELHALSDDDDDMQAEIRQQTTVLGDQLDAMEIQLLLSNDYDDHNALLAIHATTGGVDAQDWAEMLSRMYVRWAERRGLKADILDTTDGEEAGVKNATIEIRGSRAYGYAKAEAGSHRLVRMSPFDAAHRRHTAFALVEVMPEIEGDTEIVIDDDDVRVDTYRSSGAGGQHVNKTSSAVRLTHIPSGIVVTCQNERSQLQNRETAYKILRARLLERKLREDAEERAKIKGELIGAGFGTRIRSYVLHPYTQVTDHRTDTSVGDAQAVLDGAIDPFIDCLLYTSPSPRDS